MAAGVFQQFAAALNSVITLIFDSTINVFVVFFYRPDSCESAPKPNDIGCRYANSQAPAALTVILLPRLDRGINRRIVLTSVPGIERWPDDGSTKSVLLPGQGRRVVQGEHSERRARAKIRASKNSRKYNNVYSNNTGPECDISRRFHAIFQLIAI